MSERSAISGVGVVNEVKITICSNGFVVAVGNDKECKAVAKTVDELIEIVRNELA